MADKKTESLARMSAVLYAANIKSGLQSPSCLGEIVDLANAVFSKAASSSVEKPTLVAETAATILAAL